MTNNDTYLQLLLEISKGGVERIPQKANMSPEQITAREAQTELIRKRLARGVDMVDGVKYSRLNPAHLIARNEHRVKTFLYLTALGEQYIEENSKK